MLQLAILSSLLVVHLCLCDRHAAVIDSYNRDLTSCLPYLGHRHFCASPSSGNRLHVRRVCQNRDVCGAILILICYDLFEAVDRALKIFEGMMILSEVFGLPSLVIWIPRF
jgi:hypothetical protein